LQHESKRTNTPPKRLEAMQAIKQGERTRTAGSGWRVTFERIEKQFEN
jgi:hypothetical protein